MLEGFHPPRTPKSLSSLNGNPPWHYSCDLLNIEFWASPDAVRALLPAPLKFDEEGNGHASAFFVDWEFTGSRDEYLDPSRYQYREFFILLDALHDGKPVTYCPYMFVDNDAALARGWSQGYPKRLGQVFQTRFHAALGKASPALGSGRRFAGVLASQGQRLAYGLVTLAAPLENAANFAQRPVINLLYTPQLAASTQGHPLQSRLVMNVPKNPNFTDAWVGSGELTLPAAVGEEISDLAPLRCGYGLRASMSYTVDDLILLEESPSVGDEPQSQLS